MTRSKMGKKGKGSKKKADQKKKRKKKKKDDTHTSKDPSATASNQPTAVSMKKFMALYMASGPQFEKMMKDSTPEQQKKGMEAWMKWMNDNKASIVEGGAPLGKTKRVDSNGASNTKNEVGGYSVVQAESHDAATKLFGKDHPHLQMPGAWIEIMEIMPLPGMQ